MLRNPIWGTDGDTENIIVAAHADAVVDHARVCGAENPYDYMFVN